MGKRKTIAQWESEAVRQPNGCLLHPTKKRVSRVIWQLRHNTTLPSHLFVCHRCDNGECIEESHLFIGTQAENIQDCVSKRRHNSFIFGNKTNPVHPFCRKGHPKPPGSCKVCAREREVRLWQQLKSDPARLAKHNADAAHRYREKNEPA